MGHCAAARWQSEEPLFALGAMLPDFTTMCQVPDPSPADQTLSAGVAHHYRTDAAFHRLAEFRRLNIAGTRSLREAGCARGAARGTAHIAVELFLDGELVRDPGVAEHYLAALAIGAPPQPGIDFDGWEALHQRLSAREVPHGYRDPDRVAEMVVFILKRYPRLSPSPEDVRVIRECLPELRRRVVDDSKALMLSLKARLTA